MDKEESIDRLTTHLFRENSGKMVAVLSRIYGLNQIDAIMDVIQDTFEAALTKWRFSGVPDNPPAWLMQVAKNKAINVFKRESKTQLLSPSLYLNRFDGVAETQENNLTSAGEIEDSQLRLLFACCHREFSAKNQVIITLHILCGFGLPEISNALVMNREAVKKALMRCKGVLRKSENIMQASTPARPEERTHTARTILYLMFNEGYKTTRSKEAIDHDLCYEAIRLAKLLDNKADENNAETKALLALMFFNISRFPARLDYSGEWLSLGEQDRSKWNKIFIEEGYGYLREATRSQRLSRFHIEAVIASLHCAAPSFEETDWPKIAELYRQLEKMEPDSPMVKLNRIMAESYVSTSGSIAKIDALAGHFTLKDRFILSAAKGDIYTRKGKWKDAQSAYEQALDTAVSPADKKFLKRKLSKTYNPKNQRS